MMLVRRHADALSFAASLQLHYSVRVHAAVLLAAAALGGLLVSFILLLLGLEAPFLRFPIAVLAAYGLFLLFVDWWLAYIGIKQSEAELPDPSSLPGGSGGSSEPSCAAPEVVGRGGTFDGGGASGGWDAETGANVAAAKGHVAVRAKAAAAHASLESKAQAGVVTSEVASGAAEAGSGVAEVAAGAGEALGAIEFFPVLILFALVAAFIGVVGWPIVSAPAVMIETAVDVAVASGLIRSMARKRSSTWFMALVDRTLWKAVLLVAVAVALGIIVRMIDPSADTIGQAVAHLAGKP